MWEPKKSKSFLNGTLPSISTKMVENIKAIVRICDSDLSGQLPIKSSLRRIKGISYSYANAVCSILSLNNEKIGSLSPETIKKLEDVIKNPLKYNIPTWLINRIKDYESGEDKHLVGTDLKFQKESDIRRLKKIKSYRGMRHASGLPSRGQRTRSNFRKKGRRSLGVQKKKVKR